MGFEVPPEIFDLQINRESSGNPLAYNPDSGATGLLQVMEKGALADYNQWAKKNDEPVYTIEDMYDPQKNMKVGYWYTYERLPQLLESQIKDKDEIEALRYILAGYNWGPTAVRKKGLGKMPSETRKYINDIITEYLKIKQ